MTTPRAWIPAIGEAHDSCFRCGRPTPLGVALCENDNPARIKGPSATQVHGTIAVGVVLGFVLLFVFLSRASTAGAMQAAITGAATRADGTTEIVLTVTNQGTTPAAASCRVSRGAVPGPADVVVVSESIPPGETRRYTLFMPAGSGASQPTSPDAFSVGCN